MLNDKTIVWRSLKGHPIPQENSIFDETWELCIPRSSGVYKGIRSIGKANFTIAYDSLLNHLQDEAKAELVFQEIVTYLETKKLIRKIPENVRKTFKVV